VPSRATTATKASATPTSRVADPAAAAHAAAVSARPTRPLINRGSRAAAAGSAARLVGVALAFVAVVALLGTAATAHRRRGGGSPYLGRMADILDITTVVALAPVACAVLNLYSWVRGLAG